MRWETNVFFILNISKTIKQNQTGENIMTAIQRKLLNHLNLTSEGDEKLTKQFRDRDANGIRSEWTERELREFVEYGTPNEEPENTEYIEEALELIEAVCEEFAALEQVEA